MNGPGPVASEGRWTPPTTECPHPDRWTSTDDESTECEVTVLIAALVVATQPDYVVETGSAWGQTSEAIGIALRANGRGRLVSLEYDAERVVYTRDRCAGLPVEVVEGSTLDYQPDGEIGLAFFDSAFELRAIEYLLYRPSMRSGTIVAFHDTAPGHGITPSGLDLRSHLEVELAGDAALMHLPTPRGVTLGRVF